MKSACKMHSLYFLYEFLISILCKKDRTRVRMVVSFFIICVSQILTRKLKSMYSVVKTAVLRGIDSFPVKIEADISSGMPSFEMVGFLASEVKEARERVRIALKNCGIELPASRITVNFTPADIRKSGSSFDLAVTAALLTAMGALDDKITSQAMFLGEIGLNGEVLPVKGTLSAAILAKELGLSRIFVPEKNKEEAAAPGTVQVIPLTSIYELVRVCQNEDWERVAFQRTAQAAVKEYKEDFSDIYGQRLAKRACEIAVSGMHNILFIGPPGSGKTMLAKRIPTILPDMEYDEILELSQIYNVYDGAKHSSYLQVNRPFRTPHHTITAQGLCGGGKNPVPGEISLAHKGVLFLDEFPEFQKPVIDMLRQPMEDGYIHIDRVGGRYRYPCDFMTVAAMNPCKCGFFPDRNRCRCTNASVHSYINRISQPILDRFDMTVETMEVPFSELMGERREESSAQIRARVKQTQEIQKNRFAGLGYYFNAQMSSADVTKFCELDKASAEYLTELRKTEELSARAHFKLLKVARTIADMEQSEQIQKRHLVEAYAFRSLDKKYWKQL